jgi:antitoxin PrlF
MTYSMRYITSAIPVIATIFQMTAGYVEGGLNAFCQQRLRSRSFLTNMNSVRTGSEAMSTDSTLTSKGQTTIPKDIRETLGMKSGDRMTFTMLPDGTVLMRVKNKSVMSLAGSLRKKGQKPVPVDLLSR